MGTLILSWLGAWGRLAKNDNFNEAALINVTRAIADIWASIATYVSVLLVFTVVNRLQWFFSVMKNMYKVQGAISSMGMFIGTRVRSKKERFKCYRWLNLAHLYLHQQTTPELAKRISDQNLLDCGLLTKKEFAQVDDALSKRRVVLGWLGVRLEYHFKGSFIIDKEYHELKECAHDVLKSINQTMPYSFFQTIIVLTYFWLMLLPFSMYYRLVVDSEFIVFEYASCIATFFVSILFLAMLNTLVNMSLPTGHDLDDINPEALLVETDESIVIFLGGGSEPIEEKTEDTSDMHNISTIRGGIALLGNLLPISRGKSQVHLPGMANHKSEMMLPGLEDEPLTSSKRTVSFAHTAGDDIELTEKVSSPDLDNELEDLKMDEFGKESMPLVLDKNIDSVFEGPQSQDSDKLNTPRKSVPLMLDSRIDTAWIPEEDLESEDEVIDQSDLIDNTVHNQSASRLPKRQTSITNRAQSMADVMAGAILHDVRDVHDQKVDTDSMNDGGDETKMDEEDTDQSDKR